MLIYVFHIVPASRGRFGFSGYGLNMNRINERQESNASSAAPVQEDLWKRVLKEFISLLLKCAVVAVLLLILFGYVFGTTRNLSMNMEPWFQDGDLIFFYRITQSYAADDVIVIHYQDQKYLERVAAVAGDTVDIGESGLAINGSLVQEHRGYGETTQFTEGVTFPLTVPEGKVFVLGDNREHATDSRIFGCIETKDIEGKVIGVFRRRNF